MSRDFSSAFEFRNNIGFVLYVLGSCSGEYVGRHKAVPVLSLVFLRCLFVVHLEEGKDKIGIMDAAEGGSDHTTTKE